MATSLDLEILKSQDDRTSGAIIECLKSDDTFKELAGKELALIVARDGEDAEKLQKGVDEAIKKGVLPADLTPPEYEQIDVLGKSADMVADEILAKLPSGAGCVMILVGLSGTGKGTTVDKLKAKLPNAMTWSNGNCFRALTLLAVRHCEQAEKDFDPACLTPENLASWAGMLKLEAVGGKFDIRIEGLGINNTVSEIANTLLKEPWVAKNIPTVAQETQGEVVKFASEAVKIMQDAGAVVLLEGREQTLNFIPSPYRFCLIMSDTVVIGARRAAQRIAAEAVKGLKDGDDVVAAVKAGLATVAST